MTRLQSRAVLHRLLEVLEDPAPVTIGHARHVRMLVREALEWIAGPRAHESGAWSGPASGEPAAALAPEDPAATDPGL
ncbi:MULTISPECIES: hypothetical protein [unclassified Rathayibacter]|jgi:hypothetical protein|uniref:hypothetical protein n=1 Tax=unclassified Rathayibacter TaxID=2609250 RepID=UPI000CE7F1D2|nr:MULTISPECIES: hypothetical protein [unclassified Rathayibacter]PPF49186.1 hypothetical protein C5E14_04590 [Rathayibacter sp. AY1A1]PPF59086.1 hypothetical protein C5C55_02165 [Rathayibacter sp. AY1C2]PPG63720.1 hypothetical protein C5C69_00280 [Rathayibacter sp. AY1C7]PPG86842.1 hypothetical protein C5C29_00930 [Rathayibacter sp. AY1H2]PPG92541.1 hypothetical protein C5C39_03410 [Rathayibacter sp. AY1F3]